MRIARLALRLVVGVVVVAGLAALVGTAALVVLIAALIWWV